MPDHDFTPLFNQYPGVIAQLLATCTSHQFILRLAQQSRPQYILARYMTRTETHSGPFEATITHAS